MRRANQKLHQFYTINGIVCIKLEENDPPKSITHMLDLVNLFPDIEIDSLEVDLLLGLNISYHVHCWVYSSN